jgi:hypothetical protein
MITLLHLRATELHLDKKMVYRARPTEDGGLFMDQLAQELRRGREIPMTEIEANVCKALIYFSFPTLIPFRKKELAVLVVDGAGELQQYLFRPLLSGNGRPDIDRVMRELAGFKITQDECELFFSSILDADAYLFAVDGQQACSEQNGGKPKFKNWPFQETALSGFTRNIIGYKDLNKSSPRPKGFGILITKADGIDNGNFDPEHLEQFMTQNLVLGWAALSSLCAHHRIKPKLFYHQLHPVQQPNPKDPGQKYEVEVSPGRSMITYPTDQYDGIIDWFHSLAHEK